MAMTESCEWDGGPKNPPTDQVKLSARESHYHPGRARYLMRDRDPETLAPTSTRSKPRGSESKTRPLMVAALKHRATGPSNRRLSFCQLFTAGRPIE